jgi:amidase
VRRLTKDHNIYRMSKSNPAAIVVDAGERIRVQTEDCYGGRLRTKKDRFTKDMWSTVNPATGPIYFKGANPGNILRVDIHDIRTRKWAAMCVEAGAGALGDRLEGVETTIHPIRGKTLVYSKKLELPIAPMIGVIGTAPARREILNGTPGEHGGNMDCREIRAGSSVFLPIYHQGALLALGDIHALMGDGEVVICGAETSGEITVSAQVVRGRREIPTPCVETAESILFVGSSKTLDRCEKMVLEKAHRFLTRFMKLKPNEAGRIMSLVGQLQVCQVVDPLKSMKFVLPKPVLMRLGLRLRARGVLRGPL